MLLRYEARDGNCATRSNSINAIEQSVESWISRSRRGRTCCRARDNTVAFVNGETCGEISAAAAAAVSWIRRHLDTSSLSSAEYPVSERRSEFRYTVALPLVARTAREHSSPIRRGGKGKRHKGRRQEAGKTRRRGRASASEAGIGSRGKRLLSPAGRPVIYRPEPSPSLTPLLRNYTRPVANKSKKVSAALAPSASVPFPRAKTLAVTRGVLAPSVRGACESTFASGNSIEILVQIQRALAASPPRRSRTLACRASGEWVGRGRARSSGEDYAGDFHESRSPRGGTVIFDEKVSLRNRAIASIALESAPSPLSLSLSLSLSFLVRLGSSRGTSPAESSLHASANRETKKSATRSLYTSERASAEFLSGRPACASLPTSRPPR